MMKGAVCGMGVEESDVDTLSKSYKGQIFNFCSTECMILFLRDPEDYISTRNGAKFERDLICAMDVDILNPPYTTIYKGRTYYFCCNSCKREFERDPERFRRQHNEGA